MIIKSSGGGLCWVYTRFGRTKARILFSFFDELNNHYVKVELGNHFGKDREKTFKVEDIEFIEN